MLFPVITALACVPFLASLWPLSMFGMFVYVAGVMGSLYVHIAREAEAGHIHPSYTPVEWDTLPRFMGTAVYVALIFTCVGALSRAVVSFAHISL